jgi:hypothetical protein
MLLGGAVVCWGGGFRGGGLSNCEGVGQCQETAVMLPQVVIRRLEAEGAAARAAAADKVRPVRNTTPARCAPLHACHKDCELCTQWS